MIEKKLSDLVIHDIDSKATYDALVNQKDYKAVMALRKGGEEDVK